MAGFTDPRDQQIRNSHGQAVQEPGRYGNNVYLKDCPMLIGQENVALFQRMQASRDRHTISSVDDFSRVAKMNDAF